MKATSLKQFLQSICFKSPWNYAVFWKLQHQCPMGLTWEDGHFNIPCGRCLISNYHIKGLNGLLSPNCGSRSHNECLDEHPIVLAMAEMSSTCHLAGKGAVGEVASFCTPRWISSDRVAAAELSFGSVAECSDEWLLQFVAGIKTILLVPCIPHGVLQLGSMETVVENVEVVTNIAAKFDAHIKFVENFLPGGESFLLQSTLPENLDIPSATTTNMVNEDEVTAFPLTSIFEVQSSFQLSGKHMPNASETAYESETGKHHANMIDLVKQINHQLSDDNRSGITENSLGRSSCHAKDVDAFSHSSCNVGGGNVYNEVDFNFDGDVLDPQSLGKDCSDNIFRYLSYSLSCPTEFELHRALGSTIQDDTNHYINNFSGFGENTASKSIYIADHMSNIEPSFGKSNDLKEDNAENLLEAVVAGASCFYDDYSLLTMTGLESLNMPLEKPAPSRKRKNQSTGSALVGDNTVSRSTLTSASVRRDKYASSFGCVISAFHEGQHQTEVFSCQSRREESKLSNPNTNKKRGRSGDSHKPRPRDRQLIQDRLKELRQLVPNGAKCSIDGLLHKTIKHMLFLRSVTDQADKLRCQAQKEVTPARSPQSLEVKTSCQQGTCWALELGSEDQICPIMVKDLEYPGHMLIEMMCDDHARFLDITDVIHRLELTILKGVMEKRSESTWAHFIVEASGSFHRLDIFWPLMQLLQQVPSSISRKM